MTTRATRATRGALALVVAAALTAAGCVPVDRAAANAAQHHLRPGDLLSATKVSSYLLPGLRLNANSWHITYESTLPGHRSTVVSGTVLVPTSPYDGPRPLVGFAVGSQGLGDHCAASAQLAAGTEYETENIAQLLAKGWAVAVTDYPGLGTPGQHTYAIGRALGPSVLDSMRAARQLEPAHLPAHGPAAVMGYSEGGGAAGWAAQLQPTYAPDLPLVGAAVGGVIANLKVIAAHLDGSAFSFLIPYTAVGMQRSYPSLHLRRFLTPAGRADVAKLEKSCITDASLDYPAGTKSRSITTRNLFAAPAVKRIIHKNHLGRRAPKTPVLLQQSPMDEILPYSQAVALAHNWCHDGGRVEFRSIAAPDHITGGIVSDPIAIAWLAQRFEHQKLPVQCTNLPKR